MKIKKPNAELIWKQFEDLLVPRLRLSVIDRAVYSRLLRHSRLEGKLRLRFSIAWLARAARLSNNPARNAVRRLVDHGALRLVDRTKAGHVVEVRLPDEIRAARPGPSAPRRQPPGDGFHENQGSPPPIHSRERGLCFYCLRHITALVRTLDPVAPRVELGRNSYRNLVSCCLECNSKKGHSPAADFLRWLYRKRRLTAVASGKLPPPLATTANPLPRKGRPPLRPANP